MPLSQLRSPLLDKTERERSIRRTTSLGHSRLPFKLNVRRLTSPYRKLTIFFSDIFQSMVDLPTTRFLFVFVFIYLGQYFVFGLMYFHQSDQCIDGVEHYLHAVWFSVQTSRTIGYGSYGMAPNPNCTLVNVYVMFQTVVATFLDTVMFGVVFTRFSNPMLRKSNLQYSRHVVLHKRAFQKGFAWCLTCRVANIRSHGLLSPSIKMLVSMKDEEAAAAPGQENQRPDAKFSRNLTVMNLAQMDTPDTDQQAQPAADPTSPPAVPTNSKLLDMVNRWRRPSRAPAASQLNEPLLGAPKAAEVAEELAYTVYELQLPEIKEELNKMTLGFPCSVTHVIDRNSPLFSMSIEQMEERRVEIFVIVEGIDPATSNAVRGIKTYTTSDILMNRVFSGLLMQTKSGNVGLRLNDFDHTAASEPPSPRGSGAGASTSTGAETLSRGGGGLKRVATGATELPSRYDPPRADYGGIQPSAGPPPPPPPAIVQMKKPPHKPSHLSTGHVRFDTGPGPSAPPAQAHGTPPMNSDLANRLQLLMAALQLESGISDDARASLAQFSAELNADLH